MARTLKEIKDSMTAEFIGNADIIARYGIDAVEYAGKTFDQLFSKVSLESVLFGIFAICAQIIEKMIDTHKSVTDAAIAAQKAHTVNWYASKMLAYQEGQLLVTDTDYYDNSLLTDDEIEAKKIIKSVSVAETETYSLQIKIKSEDGELFEVSQIAAIKSYINEIKDIGVPYDLVNAAADSIRLSIDVYYNAQILDSSGALLTDSNTKPVVDAINEYLAQLRFDGYYTNQDLVDKIQVVTGVSLVEIKQAESRYGSYPYQVIDARIKPYSGWFKIYDEGVDLQINYIPQ